MIETKHFFKISNAIYDLVKDLLDSGVSHEDLANAIDAIDKDLALDMIRDVLANKDNIDKEVIE